MAIASVNVAAAAGKCSRYKVPNLERGLRIMELLLDFPNGLPQSEIATRLHFSKTSVYRITMTLVDYGYLLRDEETKAVRLSRKLVAMGSRVLAEEDLLGSSMDILKELRNQVRETVLIGTLVEETLVVLGQVLGSHPFKFSVDLGTRLPLHSAAPAKAMLAFLPGEERTGILRRISFEKFNERTLSSVQAYERELEQVMADGYAVDRQEQLSGIHCVAAPVFNRHSYPVAAIWTTGPTDRLRISDFARLGEIITTHAERISNRLGFGLLPGNGGQSRNGNGKHE